MFLQFPHLHLASLGHWRVSDWRRRQRGFLEVAARKGWRAGGRAGGAPAAEAGIIPYKSEKGKWLESPYDGNSWWTGGFWPGLMWLLYAQSGEKAFLTEARRVEKLLTDEFRVYEKLNHDVGFMYLLSCGADAKLTGLGMDVDSCVLDFYLAHSQLANVTVCQGNYLLQYGQKRILSPS